MYKITNIFDDERGFETDGKLFALKPKESVIVRKKPEAPEGVFKIEQTQEGQEEKAKKPEENQKSEVKK